MPSSDIMRLSTQIEQQQTDSFGKFYMYAALLHTLTIRKKSFVEALPKHPSQTTKKSAPNTPAVRTLLSQALQAKESQKNDDLNTGIIPQSFIDETKKYSSQFATLPSYSFTLWAKNRVLRFLRQDKIDDILFIVKKMNAHIEAVPMATAKYNYHIFSNIDFAHNQPGIVSLLRQIIHTSDYGAQINDNRLYGQMHILVGLLALTLTWALSGIWLSLAVGLSAAYIARYFFNRVNSDLKEFAKMHTKLSQTMQTYVEEVRIPAKEGNTVTNQAFIINSVIAPLAYMSATEMEHDPQSEDDQLGSEERSCVDLMFSPK